MSGLRIQVPRGSDNNKDDDDGNGNGNDDPSEVHYDEPVPHRTVRSLNGILGEPVLLQHRFTNSPSSSPGSNGSTFMPPVSPISAQFDRIAQLPTPVLKNGSFSNYSHAQYAMHSPPRRRQTGTGTDSTTIASAASGRIVSDYKPIARVRSLNFPKRINSNPAQVSSSSSSSLQQQPQPPPPPPQQQQQQQEKPQNTPSASSTICSLDSNRAKQEREQEQEQEQGREQQPSSQQQTIESPITPNTSPTLPQLSKFSESSFYSKRFGITFSFVREIGQGNFSKVVLAKSFDDEVAIKIITIPESKSQIPNFKSFIKRELNILYHVSYHPCITSLIDYDITLNISSSEIECETLPSEESEPTQPPPPPPGAQENSEIGDTANGGADQLIFMNYCHGGNLLNFLLQHNQSVNIQNLGYWIYLKRVACELILTTAFLHEQNIIHRDIKLENILLLYTAEEVDQIFACNQTMETPFINLSDFGLSKKLDSPEQLLQTRCGSQDYISPEILMGLSYDGRLTDTWAVGVLIYCMLENKLPFDVNSNSAPNSKSPSGISPSVLKRRRSKKTSTAHRIAMIDWGWLDVHDQISSQDIDAGIREIFQQLKLFVDMVLVRKDRRPNVGEIIKMPEFRWITECVPAPIVSFATWTP
ncbi:uncharacterized protein LODBEIA_P56500 [Lodderomyces beijingensis]|uniref:Protein kinase domain-containing protein n=1 Tax=Lodderomyces beijingensis TaxID=1775926 RepID=A0ABP0ZTG2_9ASCO